MNVCLLNDSFPPVIDGVANAVINYAGVLEGMEGNEVAVGTPGYPDARYDGYPYAVVPYRSYDTTKLISGYRAGDPFEMQAINALKKFRPDIIHSHCPAASTVMARILRKETGAPIVFTYHTKFDVDIAAATESKLLRRESVHALVSNINACDEVWTVSRGAGENLRSLGWEGEFVVMNNGVDFAKGRADDEAVKAATADFDLPAGVPVFLFVGRLMKYKGLPLILDAVKQLSESGTDYRMIFVGSGRDADELKNTVREYGITLYEKTENGITRTEGSLPHGAVIFTGPVYDRNELRAWNTRADLFLFPSTYDTNGIVVREAAACGLASVLIEGSCAAEGITDRRNGYIIEEDPESMFRLLRDVAPDLSEAARVGQNAMDEIYISWEDSVKTAYARYGEILRMKADGELEARRKAVSDVLLDAAAGLIDAFSAAERQRDRLFDSFRENMYGMKENFAEAERRVSMNAENMKSILRRFEDNVREEIVKAWKKQNAIRKTVAGAVKKAASVSAKKTAGAAKTGAGAVAKASVKSAGAVTKAAKKTAGAVTKAAKATGRTAKKVLPGSKKTTGE
ncbi:MAG: glycosyltransferase [Ruminiclostridium sp.]|nr:glycosyltransferase [Ruminiclostridium sp.]